MRHLYASQQLDLEKIERLFLAADTFEDAVEEPLRGKILASLFYEPSTRTRFSFESAMIRLGGHVLTTENAQEFSSAIKGETLEDTIRVIGNYADGIVLRHPEAGASERAASVSAVPIINAGDGAGQHPTQALLDLYTIKRELGHIDAIHVAIVGDLTHGRTARSLCYLLGKYSRVRITLVAHPDLRMKSDITDYLTRHHIDWEEQSALDSVIEHVDVVYQTRMQKERFADAHRRDHPEVLTVEVAQRMKANGIIMHPLPRLDEIDPAVDGMPQAKYFAQAKYGTLVRMAVLSEMLGEK